MEPIVSLRDITFAYATGIGQALNGVTLDVPAGQICGVVGRAGAGKSTLCALLAGFIPQFYRGTVSGRAQVNSRDVIGLPVADLVRDVGLVGSNPFSQISGSRFTVFEEVAFGLENLGLPREEIHARADWALGVMELGELRERSPYALSGGQQQRLVLAATLALRPPVLVLDEPTAQLDPYATEQLAELLRALARAGTTIVFAEHRLEWAATLAERVVVLDGGQIAAHGPTAQVLSDRLLLERGIGWPRPTLMAERARAQGRWPADRPLPVTTDDLIGGLRQAGDGAGAGGAEVVPEPGPAIPSAGAVASPERGESIVRIEGVRFSYPSGVEALRGVSFSVGRGEQVALLGRNGAGKSTMVRHLNGLLRPSSGVALVDGADTRSTTVARCARHVGIVFQDVRNQLFARTVRDELRFGPRNLGFPAAQVETLVDAALETLGLRDVADQHPYDLPQGMRRLVAVAAVLAMDTPLLVLDEPTAGLDAAAVQRLRDLAGDLVRRGKSIVVVSHDLDFCYEALDRVVLMRGGQIVLDDRWTTLDEADRAVLKDEVGLPIALRVGEELGREGAGPGLASGGAAPSNRAPGEQPDDRRDKVTGER